MRVLFARALEDNALIEKWMSGMCPEKRLRIQRMRRKQDAMTVITAHRMLCFALKSTYGVTPLPDDWSAGENGKPFLKNLNAVYFNISHSGSMAMCALDDQPVGADIELVKPFRQGLERRIMSECEKQAFHQCDDKIKLFYQIWTLKESYLKYTGQGLGALGEIDVIPGEDGIESNIQGCRFALIDCIPGYQAAVCAKTAEFSVECVGTSVLDSF